ncbi:DNA-binding transcriptional regulator, FrmR family [Methanobrevibacter gottschalkii]|uniref:DNA-binding FrmR family transcriptional regulator n=2 Tax=Methanobrevibacter gottschalkii TaxID=190974 RepID=A0A3N5C3A9_9EURY|nr:MULTISPECIES: metal-sensing transcriptional repressor [Methanobrevibacter]OEC95036.1 metal-sensitive transcriptional repressor [Methanobrevibacter sp. A27]RPF52565.1 DNA-binding FrmR family transcriptional regulator [Methanobrevibacter gottschalkii DSM 11977]SEK34137.1 DNA-binding transcriptional regulator, FrmR family [Methanobrevibacter gottschalkii]
MKQCMDTENLHRRLKKIIGQLNAIDRMIEEDIPCEQILMQVNASKSALHKVGHIIVEGHLEHCVKQAMEEDDVDEALVDISSILEYYSRL